MAAHRTAGRVTPCFRKFSGLTLALAGLLGCARPESQEPPSRAVAVTQGTNNAPALIAQATQADRSPQSDSAAPGKPKASDAAKPACDGTPPSETADVTRFAVIGDYGETGPAERAVFKLVKSWDPEFIVTVGDNNYPLGEASTIDANIGYYFHDYMCPYKGRFGKASARNRFFPALGNHDWMEPGAKPYVSYFLDLPGNGRYYDVRWGNVQLFVLDTDPHEPDGVDPKSVQAEWLKKAVAASTAPWQITAGHHPPYSSGTHGNSTYMQWPFKAWGVDLSLFGHDHIYERLVVDGYTYVVNGLGARAIYPFENVLAESKVRFNSTFGAELIEATPKKLTSRFYDVSGKLVDEFSLEH
ncbi:MAG TPA: metallophosphoesterase [Polyangiaceae bacterium]|jgi:hypothetical protein|nr:metallophosphoesterase [Polyangiaceae bacterium]